MRLPDRTNDDATIAAFLASKGVTSITEGRSTDADNAAWDAMNQDELRRERFGCARLNGATVNQALDAANWRR